MKRWSWPTTIGGLAFALHSRTLAVGAGRKGLIGLRMSALCGCINNCLHTGSVMGAANGWSLSCLVFLKRIREQGRRNFGLEEAPVWRLSAGEQRGVGCRHTSRWGGTAGGGMVGAGGFTF